MDGGGLGGKSTTLFVKIKVVNLSVTATVAFSLRRRFCAGDREYPRDARDGRDAVGSAVPCRGRGPRLQLRH